MPHANISFSCCHAAGCHAAISFSHTTACWAATFTHAQELPHTILLPLSASPLPKSVIGHTAAIVVTQLSLLHNRPAAAMPAVSFPVSHMAAALSFLPLACHFLPLFWPSLKVIEGCWLLPLSLQCLACSHCQQLLPSIPFLLFLFQFSIFKQFLNFKLNNFSNK